MLNMLWAGMMAAGIFWAAFHGNMGAMTNGLLDSAKEAVTLGITMLGIMSFWCGILKIGERAGLIEALTEKMRPVIRFLFPNLPDGHPAGKYIATNMIANMLGLGWAATPAGVKAMEELGKLEEERRNLCVSGKDEQSKKTGTVWNTQKNQTSEKIRDEAKQERTLRNIDLDKRVQKELEKRDRRIKNIGSARQAGTANNEMCTFLIVNISSLQLIPINMIAYRSQYGSVNPAAIAGPALLATIASTAAGVVFCKVMDRKKVDF